MDNNDTDTPTLSPIPHTYVAGSRSLADRARALGLQQSRPTPLQQLFEESIAVRMHSVGVLGGNERLDPAGSLHYVSVRRRQKRQKPDYGALDNLFQQEPPATTQDSVVEVLDEEEEEEEEIDIVEGGSMNAAIFGIIKGTVGPAILYLPRGFRQSGFGVAIPSMLFATYMFIYSAFRLLECWKVESAKNYEMATHIDEAIKLLQPGDTNGMPTSFTPVLLTYGELARRGLGKFSFLVKVGIALFQFGVVLTYCIFVPQNLQECIKSFTGYSLPKTWFLALMLLIEIPISWIVDIRRLTPFNMAATFFIAFGLCSVLGMAFSTGFQPTEMGSDLVFVENLRTFPFITDFWFLFVGTSFFMMEGAITLIVPLQEAVFLKRDRDAFPMVNAITTGAIVAFYIFFSLICGAAFGSNIRTALTASLQGNLATVVQLAYSVAVILTFPLQNFPAMQVACTAILGRRYRPGTRSIERNILATVIILLLGIIAVVSIDALGNVVSILGSLFGIPLALIFPPLMHNSLVKDSSRGRRLANYCVVFVGVFAMGSASYATIQNWNDNSES